jgi:thiamine transporter ThiT
MTDQTSGLPNPVEDFEARAVTYHRFMLGVKWVAIVLGAVILALAISFCTQAGIFAGLFAGLIVLAVGAWAMRAFLAHSTEAEMGYPPHR